MAIQHPRGWGGARIEVSASLERTKGLLAAADRTFARSVSERLLKPTGRYVAGPPGSHHLRHRVRPLEIPGIDGVPGHDDKRLNFRIRIVKATTPLGFSFDRCGWNPYLETLRFSEHQTAPERADHPLVDYYRRFTPQTVQEALLEHISTPLHPLHSWPVQRGLLSVWALTQDIIDRAMRSPQPQRDRPRQFVGPHPRDHIEADIARLEGVRDSIHEHGYHPSRFGARPISGYFMIHGDDYRFVCRQGNHRLAALAYLEHGQVDVVLASRIPPIVDFAELEWWTEERGGLFAGKVAEELFLKMFYDTGRTKAENLGLL